MNSEFAFYANYAVLPKRLKHYDSKQVSQTRAVQQKTIQTWLIELLIK